MSSDVLAEAVSASLSGIFSSTVLFPLEILKTKMQAMEKTKKVKKTTETEGEKLEEDADADADADAVAEVEEEADDVTVLSVATLMYNTSGPLAFMKGFHYSALQSALEKAIYFLAYTKLKNSYLSLTHTSSVSTIPNLVLGCLADWAHLPFSMPLDVLTTKLATDKTNASAFFIISQLFKEKGVLGLYKGYQAFLVLCLKPSIQYTIYEKVKEVVLLSKRARSSRGEHVMLTSAEAFLIGMVARAVATITLFPYIRAKVMLQSRGSEAENLTIPQMLKAVYDDEGLAGLFKGIGPELSRGVLSAAIMLTVKEGIQSYVEKVLRGKKRP